MNVTDEERKWIDQFKRVCSKAPKTLEVCVSDDGVAHIVKYGNYRSDEIIDSTKAGKLNFQQIDW